MDQTIFDLVLETDEFKKRIIRDHCPSDFGLKDTKYCIEAYYDDDDGLCEYCWLRHEYEEN